MAGSLNFSRSYRRTLSVTFDLPDAL